jgi:hypothetical protein
MRIDQSVSFIFNVSGLRIYVSGNWPSAHFLFEFRDQFSAFFCVFRAAIIGKSEATPFAYDERHLAAEKERITYYQREGRHPM